MINNQSSDITAGSTAFVPELSVLLERPDYLCDLLNSAFSFADTAKYKNILQMKQMLSQIFNGHIKIPSDTEDFISIIKRSYDALNTPLTDGFSFVFPGLISPKIPADTSVINCLTSLGSSATVSAECEDIIRMIAQSPEISWRELTILCHSGNVKSVAWLIPALADRGISVSLCNIYKVRENSAIYNAIPAVTGRSLLRILPKFGVTDFEDDLFLTVKEVVRDILTNEARERFKPSATNKLYHKPHLSSEKLIPLGLFCADSFTDSSKKHIPGILDGGASDEIVLLSPSFTNISRDDNQFNYALRCATTACRSLTKQFPFTPVVYYKDSVAISDYDMIIDAIRSHIGIFVGLSGFYSLDLIPDNVFSFTDTTTLSAVVKAFFINGGSVITFNPKGNRL